MALVRASLDMSAAALLGPDNVPIFDQSERGF